MTDEKALVAFATDALDSLEVSQALVPASKNPVEAYLRSRKAARSATTLREALNRIARLPELESRGGIDAIHWPSFTVVHAMALRAALAQSGYPPTTVNLSLCALRGVLMKADDLELLGSGVLAKCLRNLVSIGGTRLPVGRDLSSAEIAKLRSFVNTELHGMFHAFVKGILAVGLGAGLRREEICTLKLEGYERPFIRIIGKGDKERRVALSEDACNDLEEWRDLWRRSVATSSDRMFIRILRNGTMGKNMALTKAAVWSLVRWLGEQIGIEGLSTHDLRRTCATRRLDAGVDLGTVQNVLGHADPKTTRRYDRRGEREMKREIDKSGVY